MDVNKKDLAVKASILYYEMGMSQNEVAEQLEISRSYVSQLLSLAKELGVVKISIDISGFNLRQLRREIEFKGKYPKIKQVYIMQSDSEEFTENNLGKFAAPYITDLIREARVIGINLGTSVEKAVEAMHSQDFSDASGKEVVQIMGGFNHDMDTSHPGEVVKNLGTKLGCRYYYLNCPVIVEQPELKTALLKEKSIRSVIEKWNQIDLAVMGIGAADKRSKLFSLFSPEMEKQIMAARVRTELNINFFKENGDFVPLLEDNKISIPYKQLKKVKSKIIIANGEYKKHSIAGALKAGMIDVLITDSTTADAVMGL